ncbi:MAG: RIP metalloprotease RseP [Saccharofermentans sp.]|nr:RIP metalloprotease RseP [Saccharofermentans sp.]
MSIWSILVVIVMLGVLVTIHELGHFWVALLLGVKVYEVSIFVGPPLVTWKRKGVEYSIRALPFGAYVRFSDFDDEGRVIESDDPKLLVNQKRWKRLLVALAGPFMNAVLGIVIFTILYSVFGFSSLKIAKPMEGTQLYNAVQTCDEFTPGDTIVSINGEHVWTYLDCFYELENGVDQAKPVDIVLESQTTGKKYTVTLTPDISKKPMLGVTHYDGVDNKYHGWEIVSVMDSQNNGKPILKAGDYLIEVDGKKVADEDFVDYFNSLTDGDTMKLTYVRNGEVYEKDCVKTMMLYTNARGVGFQPVWVKSVGTFFTAVKTAVNMPFTVTNISIKAIGDVFEGKEEVYNMVSGPVGVTTVVSDVVDDVDDNMAEKVYNIISLAGIISIGLMFSNMLPIPGLDGIQIILVVVEMVIGHKLSDKAEKIINVVGFFMLLALVIFAFASDIIRIIMDR